MSLAQVESILHRFVLKFKIPEHGRYLSKNPQFILLSTQSRKRIPIQTVRYDVRQELFLSLTLSHSLRSWPLQSPHGILDGRTKGQHLSESPCRPCFESHSSAMAGGLTA